MEFDKFEEFGEFEMEVEKGGEVIVEKLAAVFEIQPAINFRVGHIIVPVGLVAKRHRPQHYFTTTRPESESNLIPTTWHENGLELFGSVGRLGYQVQVVNGLDSTGFSSRRWIVGGHQLRFETANAEDFALVGRVDYTVVAGAVLGISGYYGDSADNRPKPDLRVDAHVSIVDLHGFYEVGGALVKRSISTKRLLRMFPICQCSGAMMSSLMSPGVVICCSKMFQKRTSRHDRPLSGSQNLTAHRRNRLLMAMPNSMRTTGTTKNGGRR